MTLTEAHRDYPNTLRRIWAHVDKVKATTGGDIIAMSAELVVDNGVPRLRLIAMTDLVPEGAEMDCRTMSFGAPIVEAVQ